MKAQTRREFLRRGACALGGVALASTVESLRIVNALAPQAAADYRALVCVFLNGGNDGDNMVIPFDNYAAYSAARGPSGLALPQASILQLNPARGRTFGFHTNMPELRDLFNKGKLAVLFNTGPLLEPLTRAAYLNGTGQVPPYLFSHLDQVRVWQTAQHETVGVVSGWGGRTADRAAALNGPATFPQLVSIFNINRFNVGVNTRPLALFDSSRQLNSVLVYDQAPGFTAEQTAARRAAVDEATGLGREAVMMRAAGDVRSTALRTSETLATVSPSLATVFPNTTLGRQLEQVARVISLRNVFGMKRQIFFCYLDGFDTHSRQREVHDALLQEISRAMLAFYDSTVEMGVAGGVTTFTLSDFGRTFDSAGVVAGVGSDHGWGNNHLIMGGAVRGGDFYGTPSALALGGPDDTDGGSSPRGRWIPTTSIEQYAATLARWYGV